MRCKEIIDILESAYPKKAALEFDNVGLLAGRADKEVTKIYVALDATDEVVEAALSSGADMLLTHHPLIFSPLKRVTDEDSVGRRIVNLIQHDISYYAMHTNYDVLGMAELAGALMELQEPEVLEVTYTDTKEEGIGRVGDLKEKMTLAQCCTFVKKKLELSQVKVFGDMDCEVRRLAISPGSGKSMIRAAKEQGADVLVTGDIGHHEGLDALAENVMIIDAGHYGTEYIFIEDVKKFLEEKTEGVAVETPQILQPFQVV